MNYYLNSIVDQYKGFNEVKAIALGGSSMSKTADKSSDIDMYVFVDNDIPVEKRENLIKKFSSKYEAGCDYFGSGDEFFVNGMNQQLDVMYWNRNWFENVVHNVWEKHQPSNGYSTCFLHTLNIFDIIHDTDNWLQGLKDKLKTPYPEELKDNIVKRNMMLLKDKPFASYYEQIEKAIKRGDENSVNHRIAAFMASYFDVLFAKNKILHPGEKRLVQFAKNNCKALPEMFEENINKLFIQPNTDTLKILANMVENIRKI